MCRPRWRPRTECVGSATYDRNMSERLLEIVRQPDGRYLASFDEGQPAVPVSSWDDIRRLRGRRHVVDHWAPDDLQSFIKEHGHPFDDWWSQLSAGCAEALLADPSGPVPLRHHDEVKRTLRHQPLQTGLGLEGSSLTAEVRSFIAGKAGQQP
jgi:hypothetical protein